MAEDRLTSVAARQWASPGVSRRKRWLTGIGVALAAVIFLAIGITQGTRMLVSTLLGIVFIGGFIGYLRVVAPTPYVITLDGEALTRSDAGAEPVRIPWASIAKIKEERFPHGTPVSIAVFKRVGEHGLHRAWVAYGDDLPDFDGLVAALQSALPEDVPWLVETVHD